MGKWDPALTTPTRSTRGHPERGLWQRAAAQSSAAAPLQQACLKLACTRAVLSGSLHWQVHICLARGSGHPSIQWGQRQGSQVMLALPRRVCMLVHHVGARPLQLALQSEVKCHLTLDCATCLTRGYVGVDYGCGVGNAAEPHRAGRRALHCEGQVIALHSRRSAACNLVPAAVATAGCRTPSDVPHACPFCRLCKPPPPVSRSHPVQAH